jgi:fatty-acid desaturase
MSRADVNNISVFSLFWNKSCENPDRIDKYPGNSGNRKGENIMNAANLKRIALIAVVLVVAFLLASFLFKALQFVIVAGVIAVIAAIIYAVVAPKVLGHRNGAKRNP